MKNLTLASALVVALAICAPANAAVTDYDLVGTATGTLGGVAYTDASFDLRLVGDNSKVSFNALDLSSVSVTIDGTKSTLTSSFDFGLIVSANIFYINQIGGSDLLDGFITEPATKFSFQSGFGPAAITGVYALTDSRTRPFGTSNGGLEISSVSGLELTSSGGSSVSSAVPEPSTWVMMLAGFAALGFAGYRRNAVRPEQA